MIDSRQDIQDYYASITTEGQGQMETSICSCAADQTPKELKPIISQLPDEIVTRFYGCGSPIPDALEGCTVVDLGCGTGRDVYILSQLVGEEGKVIGVDMTDDQLDIARKYQDQMADAYGYKTSNVAFKKGYIEDLKSLGIEDESVDIVVSNCVINLSPDKAAVFNEIWRVLKPGGELYFSDIFCDRRLSEELAHHPVLRGECLGGAMYIEDFRRLMHDIGWVDFRYMSSTVSTIDNPDIEDLVGNAQFTSRTVRAMKIPDYMEDICENYGQFAVYRGGILGSEWAFDLDDHHHFEKDLPMAVCGNSCAMLEHTRFSKYFDCYGDRSQHFGAFEGCSTAEPVHLEDEGEGSTSCCGSGGCC